MCRPSAVTNRRPSVTEKLVGQLLIDQRAGQAAAGVAADPATGTVDVANGGDGTVSVISEAAGAVTVTIGVGSDPSGTRNPQGDLDASICVGDTTDLRPVMPVEGELANPSPSALCCLLAALAGQLLPDLAAALVA